MRIGRILFLAIFLFAVSMILGSSAFLEKLAYDFIAQESSASDLNSITQKLALRENYKQDLLALLGQAAATKMLYPELENKLLGLTVPAEYRDLHFKLVTALAELNNQPKETAAAKKQLEKLQQTYIWLANQLTVFIIHNF